MKRYLRHLLQLVLSPGNGWEDIASASISPREIALKGYYPLIMLTAVSVFAQWVWHHSADFTLLFMRMIITAIVYFIGYFFGVFILSVFLEPCLEGRYDEARAQTFTLYTLGLLAVISLLINCLPVSQILLFFLPIYVGIIQWKGVAYMGVRPDKAGVFMFIAVLGVLCPPYLFYFLFSLLLA